MNTDNLFEHARSRFDHAAARRNLREKYEAKLLFAHAGGMWRAGPELQTTLLTCPDAQCVLIDLYETPVRVDVQELMKISQQRWQEQLTAWLVEFDELNTKR